MVTAGLTLTRQRKVARSFVHDPALIVIGLLAIAFVGYPIVTGVGYLRIDALRELVKPQNLAALENSLLLVVCTVIPASLMAVPLAWLCARTTLPGKGVVVLLASISFVMPALLTAIAYAFLFGRNAGLLNRLSIDALGFRLFDVYSFAGVAFVTMLHCYPLIFFSSYSGLMKMDPELEEAGRSCGLTPLGVFLNITLGAVLPSVLAGVAFACVETLTMLAAPMVLGLPKQIPFITTELYSTIVLNPDLAEGIAFGVPLVMVTIALIWVQQALLDDPSGRKFALVSGKGARGDIIALRGWTLPMTILAWIPIFISLIVPVLTLLAAAMMKHWFLGFKIDNFTWSNFAFVLSDRTTALSITNSIVLALTMGVAAALIGGTVAIAISGQQTALKKVTRAAVTLPLGLPHVVTGVLVILAWYGAPFHLGGTLWILLLGYLLMMLPFSVKTCESACNQIDATLVDASKVIGCRQWETWYHVLFPLMKNGIVTTFVISFLVVIKEFSLTAMVYSADTQTLAVRIYTILEGGSYEKTAAAAMTLVVMTFACLTIVGRFFRISPISIGM
jgi:iron(III) transport system permease protein